MTPDPDVIEYTGFRDLEPDGVLEQPFYERYNSRLEMPIAFSLAVLIPVAIVALAVFFSYFLPDGRNTNPVSIIALDGEDDKGFGSAGSGGDDNPVALGQQPSQADLDRLPREAELNAVKEELQKAVHVDGVTDVDVSDSTAVALATLDDQIRKKIAGSQKGSGNPAGSGGNPGPGTGVGGNGADSTRARALRWIIKFDTRTGADYLDQIGGLKGIVLLQVKDNNRDLYIFRDPRNPASKAIATDKDFESLAGWLRFEDIRRNSVEAVAETLNLGYTPPMFIVFFPKEFEAKLDRLERQHNNHDPKDIRETTFKVIRRGGEYDLQVVNQILK